MSFILLTDTQDLRLKRLEVKSMEEPMNEVVLIKGDTMLIATQPQSTAIYFLKEPKCNLGNAVNPVNNKVCHTVAAKCAK